MSKSRAEQLFSYVVESYIETAEPVSSKRLCDEYGLDFSSATVRAELLELERSGYLIQPHTSAGRIPTEKGYRYYVEHLMADAKLSKKELEQLAMAWSRTHEYEQRMKSVAKRVADLAHSTVIIAYSNNKVYYTGIKNLFSQPEFEEAALLTTISTVLDELDERIDSLLEIASQGVGVLVGKENPLGNRCSIVTTRISDDGGLLVVLGPMRMNYAHNIKLIERAKDLMSE
jgi:heat-inducible transcriptional repressor